VWGCCGGVGVGGGGARAWPTACRVARRSGPAPALATFPVPPRAGAQLWTASFCWGGWLVWCGAATHAERSVAACNRRPPSSTSASTSGLSRLVLSLRLWRVVGWVGFLSGRDWWGGERIVGGVPRINIVTWGLCDCLCLVLVCRGFGEVLLFILGSSLGRVGPVRGLRGGGRGG